MPDPTPKAQPTPRPSWRRLFFSGLLGLVIAAVAFYGFYLYKRHSGARALEAAVAEASREDPDWQLPDIEAHRAKVPAADNAAIPVLKAMSLIPEKWADDPQSQSIGDLLPNTALDDKESMHLRQLVQPLQGAVALALEAIPLQHGWVKIDWQPDYLSTPSPWQDVVKLGILLRFQTDLLDHTGDHDAAFRCGLAILAASRAIDAEPHSFSQMLRLHMRGIAVASLERTLAQAPKSVSPGLLELAQQQLRDEANQPILVPFLRGQRAGLNMLMSNLEAGLVGKEKERAMLRDEYASDLSFFLHTGATFKHDHGWLLDFFNKAIAIAKGAAPDRLPQFKLLEKSLTDAPPIVRMLTPAVEKISLADLRIQAFLDCAVAGIAVERFRLANQGSWPPTLAAVVGAKLLDKVPLDVFDGQPLRYRKTTNGVVVYSIGPNGTYSGDALDTAQEISPAVMRFEFRLWNPEQRGKGPRPAPHAVEH
jgi:hypothetical protein